MMNSDDQHGRQISMRGPQSLRTVSVNPSTATTRTRAPSEIDSSAVALPDFAVRRDRPGRSGSIGRQRLARLADHAVRPVTGGCRCAATASRTSSAADRRRIRARREDDAQAHLQFRSGESTRIIEPKIRLASAADRQQSVAGHLDFEHEEQQAEQRSAAARHSSPAAAAARRTPAAATRPHDSRQDGAGGPQFDRQPQHARGSAAGRRCWDARSR